MEEKIRLRNIVGNLEVEGADPLAIIIGLYFDSHPRRPDESEYPKSLLTPWVMRKTDEVLDSIAELITKEK